MTGAEGSITVSVNPTPATGVKVYEGDEKVAVYGIKVQAAGSDVDVQRATLQFNQQPWSYMTNVYLYDGDTQVASSPLNSTTVSRISSSEFQITLTGFTSKVIVAKGASKVLTVKVDALPGLSSGLAGMDVIVSMPSNAIRAIDQAGLNQYGNHAGTRTFTMTASQSATATLAISRNTNSPLSRNIVAETSGDITGATLLTFNIKATKDNMILDQINNVAFSTGGTYVDPTTAYLVDDAGNTIGTATPSSNEVDFTGLNYAIAKDTTKTFSIKVDKSSVVTNKMMKATITGNATNIVAEKSNGAFVTTSYISGEAASYDAYIYTAGPVFTLSNVATTSTPSSTSASSTISATFTVNVEAKGGDVYMVADGQSGNGTVTDAFTVKTNNTTALAHGKVAYQKPSTADQYSDCGAGAVVCYKIAQDTSATFAVTATYVLDTTAGNFYLNVANIYWDTVKAQAGISTTEASTYMATDWLSNTVFLQ